MTKVLEEWLGYCCDVEEKTEGNKVYGLAYTDDGNLHRKFGGVGEQLHEQISRAPMQDPQERVQWARQQYYKVKREKAKRYKEDGILYHSPTPLPYDNQIRFDVPFLSPLGDPAFTVPSFVHELEAPLASTIALAASRTTPTSAAPAHDQLTPPPVGGQQALQHSGAGAGEQGPTLYLGCANCRFGSPDSGGFCLQ